MNRSIKETNHLKFSKLILLFGVLIIALILLTSCATDEETVVSFAADVKPILDQKCTVCHGAFDPSAGVDLSSYSGVMEGRSVVASDSSKSLLFSMVNSGDMPRGGSKLPEEQITIIKNWIDQGALDN